MNFAETYQLWRERLCEALDGRYYDQNWLDYVVMSGRAVMVANDTSACVYELRYYPTGARDLQVVCAAGNAVDLKANILPSLIKSAYDQGCIAIVVESREAWVRLLGDQGFETYKIAVRKGL